jgi:hypothetical protein
MRFRIEYVGTIREIAYVIARQIDPGHFAIGRSARLGGTPIHRWLDQPRAAKADGNPDPQVFAFVLQSTADATNFEIGQIVQMTNTTNQDETT